jgi:hypothetical protein
MARSGYGGETPFARPRRPLPDGIEMWMMLVLDPRLRRRVGPVVAYRERE